VSAADVGQAVFSDGMRVAAEHLDRLQEVALEAGFDAREAAGPGKVCYGFNVEAKGPAGVTVNPGLAFDAAGRPIRLDAPRDLTPEFGTGTRVFLTAVHAVRSAGIAGGVPTLVYDDVAIEARTAAPPYQDDGVVFAQLDRGSGAIAVTQLGDWYLPALDHGHRGIFILRAGRWRFDGDPPGLAPPGFDSGFIPVAPGAAAPLVHGLHTTDLLVQMQSRRQDGLVTAAGFGQGFWYELPDDQRIRLVRGPGDGVLDLRVSVWPMQAGRAGAVAPVADAGAPQLVESGPSFTLDGSLSTAFGGRHIVQFIWTELS
jgi:hypothetical protein